MRILEHWLQRQRRQPPTLTTGTLR